MAETKDVQIKEEEVQLPQEWPELAAKAARKYKLQVPESTIAPEEVESQIRQFEQSDGQ